ncbi:MAG TPA: carboxypeptidase regulatory-like domain-containing protein [Vicinamibacterales bacterium]|nr:carboxypeptidase regulatory-like domain-containing protein [Vicinamibacterales bacterium]
MAKVLPALALFLVFVPAVAYAQEGQIAGSVKDSSGAVMPGVTVEASSPALIEKVRTTTTDAGGQYRLTNLPVGTYKVTFSLEGFSKQERDQINLTSGFTAQINGTMSVGQLAETVVVSGAAPVVDVQNAKEVVSFTGEQIKDLPTSRNVNSLFEVTPGISSMYKPSTTFGAPGVCVGGIGVFCNPGVAGFNVGESGDQTNMNQGRVMVDGQVVNQGGSLPLGGVTGGYTADIANSQEVNIQVSGALGESETGGSTINIVPRTGGNRFSGNFNTTYTDKKFFSENNGAYSNISSVFQAVISDHDVSMGVGGPIKRDRLWFYSVGRDQGIHKLPVGIDFWPNKWEGKYGYNYQPDRSKDRVEYKNKWRSANARITWQASSKNKFNFYWDEQDFCQDPCDGVVSVFTSPESWWSVAIRPDRLQQASWTNPITNKILLEAGLNLSQQEYHTDKHRQYTNPVDIPRVVEVGTTSGGDDVASPVNQFAGSSGFFGLSSGSLNSALASGGAEIRDTKNYRLRGAASYVTGGHHAKVGYDGAFFTQAQTNKVNTPQMQFNYNTPAATCVPGGTPTCGNTSLQFPDDPNNVFRHPIPTSVTFNTGSGTANDKVWYTAFYAQDQWTLHRFTLSGALRFDNARSDYGVTCVGPNYLVPIQANGSDRYCTKPADGVSYKDLTPRYGFNWDVFGNGKTAVKVNGGKFLNAAGITGIYSGTNPARRTVNSLTRTWSDANGNRHVDCNILDPTDTSDGCGAFGFGQNIAQYGRDPESLDAAGIPVGLTTSQCGRTESAIPQAVQDYCAQYGESIVNGWDRRRNEWQFGIGIQHEILPRLSGEFTWNHRNYYNITVNDQLNIGCDRFNGATDVRTCQENMLKYSNPSYDFYTVTAPTDPRLPNGGGYQVLGLNDVKASLPANQPTAQTYMNTLNYKWNGFDTNFNWRAPKGIRIQGGTSTSRSQQNTCFSELDGPNVRGREGAEWQGGCDKRTPFQTSIRGSASYTIPWVDVLVSTVFQSLPGVEIQANVTYTKEQIQWNSASAGRSAEACSSAANGLGCLGATRNLTTTIVNLLNSNEMFGERTTYFDMKFAKNIRFSGKRAQIGVDMYNIFNSDAIQSYNNTYSVTGTNNWLQPLTLMSPRYFRFQVQFDF